MSDVDRTRLRHSGITPMPTDRALAMLDQALALTHPSLTAATWHTPTLQSQNVHPILSNLIPAQAATTRRAAAARAEKSSSSWARSLADLPESKRREATLDRVLGHVATVLGHTDPASIDPHRTFKEIGFDSLTSVELRNQLNAATGLRLPAT